MVVERAAQVKEKSDPKNEGHAAMQRHRPGLGDCRHRQPKDGKCHGKHHADLAFLDC